MKRIFKIAFLLLILLLITVFIASIVAGYRSSLEFINSVLYQQDVKKHSDVLTAGKFKLLQRLAFAVICIFSGIYYYFDEWFASTKKTN